MTVGTAVAAASVSAGPVYTFKAQGSKNQPRIKIVSNATGNSREAGPTDQSVKDSALLDALTLAAFNEFNKNGVAGSVMVGTLTVTPSTVTNYLAADTDNPGW
jgi:hypothetical protein